MDKKFDLELQKIEKLLDKVDNDLLKQGIKSDFSIFFKNMDKTFEIYNVCWEEICGQLYWLDLIFHSKVIRKLFHNYKHQLHNIMKFQLNLQKDLNMKHQEEKNLKERIGKLDETIKLLNNEKNGIQEEFNNEQKKNLRLKGDIEKLNDKVLDLQLKEEELIKEKKKMEIFNKKKDLMKEYNDVNTENNKESDDFFKKQIQDILNSKDKSFNENATIKTQLLNYLNNIENQKNKIERELEIKPNMNNLIDNEGVGEYIENNSKQIRAPSMKNLNVQINKAIQTNEINEDEKLEEYVKEYEEIITGYEKKISHFSKVNLDYNNLIKQKDREIQLLKDKIDVKNEDGYDEKATKRELLGVKKDNEDLKDQIQILEEELKKLRKLYNNITKKDISITGIKNVPSKEINETKNVKIKNPVDNEVEEEEIENFSKENSDINSKKTIKSNVSNKDDEWDENINKSNIEKSVNEENENDNNIDIDEIKDKDIKEIKIENSDKKIENESNIKIENTSSSKRDNKNYLKKIKDLKKNIELLKLQIEKLNTKNEKILEQKNRFNKLYNDLLNKDLNENEKIDLIINQQNETVDDLVNKLDNMEQIKYKLLEKIKNADDEVYFYKDNCNNKDIEIENLKNHIELIKINFLKSEDREKYEIKLKEIEKNKEKKILDIKRRNKGKNEDNSLNKSDKEEIKLMLNEFKLINNQREIQSVVRGVQTDYSSPIKYILQNKELVEQKDCTNFELIKKCADFLAELVGYEDVDDGYNENSDLEEEKIKMVMKPQKDFVQSKNRSKTKEKEVKNTSKGKNVKIIQNKDNNQKKFKINNKSKSKSKTKKFKLKKKFEKKQDNGNENENDNEEIDISSDSEYDKQVSKFRTKKKIIKKSKEILNKNQSNVKNNIVYEDLMTNLQVSNNIYKDTVREEDENLIFSHAIENDEKYNEWSLQKREREKVLFRIFVNLKKRYKFKPEKFLKIFKLYFSKEPPFFEKCNENYDPDKFLFNFEEFKEYYSELTKIHTKCGDECQHLKRFYENTGIIKKNQNKKLVKMNQILIHKLPSNKDTKKFLIEKYIKKYYYK